MQFQSGSPSPHIFRHVSLASRDVSTLSPKQERKERLEIFGVDKLPAALSCGAQIIRNDGIALHRCDAYGGEGTEKGLMHYDMRKAHSEFPVYVFAEAKAPPVKKKRRRRRVGAMCMVEIRVRVSGFRICKFAKGEAGEGRRGWRQMSKESRMVVLYWLM
ncbi:hypothetical protein C1H46_026249 [Malus baccata]|uniref:Uncharacterized protein n=1 Tax=Malus baccata TaxID=106549 RepID=A0A540LP64_MALBA|nr:hypothetical protein C1H46_026249 [Malus baccata]